MEEYCLELRLPSFQEVVNNNCHLINTTQPFVIEGIDNIPAIFNESWLTSFEQSLPINFDHAVFFRKSDVKGSVHIDCDDKQLTWAVNWVFGGNGILEFWDWEDVVFFGRTNNKSLVKKTGTYWTSYISNGVPAKAYENLENRVYLVNTSIPHRACGSKNRSVFSLRCKDSGITKWSDVTKLFRKYIIS